MPPSRTKTSTHPAIQPHKGPEEPSHWFEAGTLVGPHRHSCDNLCQREEATTDQQAYTAALAKLHPAAKSTDFPVLPEQAPLCILNADEHLTALIKKSCSGASPDAYGWTEELVHHLCSDEDCLRGLAALFNDIRNGQVPSEAKPYLLGSKLIGIPKPNSTPDAVRPIALGSTFYKLTAMVALAPLAKNIENTLLPIQLGVNVKGGVETATHILRCAALDPAKEIALFVCDFKNAFNTRDRAEIMQELFSTEALKPLWRLAFWAYEHDSPLWVHGHGNKVLAVLSSSEGVRQGDPLSSLLFALSVKKLYIRASEVDPTVRSVAIQDDVYFLGKPQSTLDCALELQRIAKPGGLQLQLHKCAMVWMHSTPLPTSLTQQLSALGIPINSTAIKLLGTPMGRDTKAVAAMIVDIAKEHEQLFLALNTGMPPQEGTLILRLCALPRMQYLCRTVPPSIMEEALKLFDALVERTLLSCLEINKSSLSDVAQNQLHLPIKLGGLGFRQQLQVSPGAFLASVGVAAPRIKLLSNHFQLSLAPLWSDIQDARNRLASLITPSKEDLLPPADAATTIGRYLSFYCSSASNVPSAANTAPATALQHLLSAIVDRSSEKKMREKISAADLSRIVCLQQRGAGAWLTVPPLHRALRLSTDQFRVAIRLRLGLAPIDDMPESCLFCTKSGGRNLKADPSHFLSCRHKVTLGAVTHRHNVLVDVLASIIRKHGNSAAKEPTYLSRLDNKRVDLDVSMGLSRFAIDVTVRHPTAPSHFAKAAQGPLEVAKQAEVEKRDMYSNIRTSHPSFLVVPFVFETFGGIGSDANRFLDTLAYTSAQHSDVYTYQDVRGSAANTLSVILQRGNADILLAGAERARRYTGMPV